MIQRFGLHWATPSAQLIFSIFVKSAIKRIIKSRRAKCFFVYGVGLFRKGKGRQETKNRKVVKKLVTIVSIVKKLLGKTRRHFCRGDIIQHCGVSGLLPLCD